jgi:hypothetical protein
MDRAITQKLIEAMQEMAVCHRETAASLREIREEIKTLNARLIGVEKTLAANRQAPPGSREPHQ